MNILNRINNPQDLKALHIKELQQLSEEIRGFLIENVSKTGGHLAPNLGIVELTTALHYVFASPIDTFLWDVGHQSYVHKILTGRKHLFSTLRQKNGLSGYPCPQESPHDTIHAGHAATSLSIGAGIAGAKKIKGDSSATIALIGDGAFTSGTVYEALNDTAWRDLPLIIILNDNKMSISENVGGIARHLEKLRTNRYYLRTKRRIYRTLQGIPLGQIIADIFYRIKLNIKGFFIKRYSVFENLGVKYMGPFDGHDLANLITIFNYIKNEKSPILLHILTKKGLGFKESEQNPTGFHGISAQDDSIPIGGKSFSSAFGEILCRLAEKEERIIAITAAMREGTGLSSFAKKFPLRFIDVGIAESHAVGAAVGLALQDFRPVVAIYSTFLQRAYDQCVHDVGIGNLPVIFCLDRAGLVPGDGKTHQGIFDISFLRTIPNFIIFTPINAQELEMGLQFALTLQNPFALRYPKTTVSTLNIELPPIILGEGFELRTGSKGVIAFLGGPLEGLFEKQWDGYALYHLRFAKPFSEKTLAYLLKFKDIIIVEENIENGSLGQFLKGEILSLSPSAKVTLKNLGDGFPTVDSREGLLSDYGFVPLDINIKK